MSLILACLALTLVSPAPGQSGPDVGLDGPLPDLELFLQQVRPHLKSDREVQSRYTFVEKKTELRLDGNGEVKKSEVEVRELYPALDPEDNYSRLISKNGVPVTEEEQAKQDRKYRERMLERRQELEKENPARRKKRLEKQEKRELENQETIDEIFRLFEFELVGRQVLEGHPCIMIRFVPRPHYKPQTDAGKLMGKVRGIAWFHEYEYELIRLEGELLDTFSYGLGILARLHKGARLEVERRKVNDEIWLPAQIRFWGSARILLVKGIRLDVTHEFSDYRKFTVDTSISYSPADSRP